MLTLVLSEKLYTQSLATDLSFPNSDTEVLISNLANIKSVDRDADIIILDLDFDDQTTSDGDTIPLFGSDLEEARETFHSLPNSVARFLNEGGVVVTLLSDRVSTVGFNQPTNYDWLDEMQVATIVGCTSPRAPIEIVSNAPPVRRYFEHVDAYENSIRLNPNVVSQPEILAKHQIDNETVAVNLNEYSDPHGVVRQVSGNLLLLPQPELTDENFASIIESLVKIGENFAEREEVEDVIDEQEKVDIELLLEKGEGETVEFKQEFPDSAHDMEKEMTSFANRRGGTIAMGITDSGGVVGVEDVDKVKNRAAGAARNLQPPIEPKMDLHTLDGKQVVSIRVRKKEADITAHRTSQDIVYRRVGPTCQDLELPEIERLYL
jgi:hypothetical protein